jgi:hypothetical protein
MCGTHALTSVAKAGVLSRTVYTMAKEDTDE